MVQEKLQESNRELTALSAELEKRGDELRIISRQFWQSAKLATMGELTASIAHELNNPLQTVNLHL